MKKILSTFLISSIIISLNVCPASAENTSLQLKTDGSLSDCSIKWNSECDRLLVDTDYIKATFGAEVSIDDNTIILSKNRHTLTFEVGNEFYVMNSTGGRKIGSLAEITDNKAYLPLRYICEAFGAGVSYKNGLAEVTTNEIFLDESIKPYFENVEVYDQSTIKVTGEKTIYVDPRRLFGEPHDADIIFITHTHTDHYEIETIRKIIKPETVIYIPSDGIEQAKADGLENVVAVEPGKDYEANGIPFSTIAAYNTASDRQNHKSEFNWVGYIFTANGHTYYSAGDTDFTEEMKGLQKPIDVAFLPIDGKYNMEYQEAAQAANALMPKVAVPYHYNNFITEDMAQKFVDALNNDIKGAIVTFKMN